MLLYKIKLEKVFYGLWQIKAETLGSGSRATAATTLHGHQVSRISRPVLVAFVSLEVQHLELSRFTVIG